MYFQAVVMIGDVKHVHSQLFDTVDIAEEEIAKNKAYKFVGFISVVINEDLK